MNESSIIQNRTPGRKRGSGRFGDYTADAAALGVSSFHLWCVLAGRRVSRRLTAAYQALKAAQAKAAQ